MKRKISTMGKKSTITFKTLFIKEKKRKETEVKREKCAT